MQGVEAQVAERVKMLEEACQQESKALAQYVQKGLEKVSTSRLKVVDAMKEKEKEFKGQLTELWAQYQQTFAKEAAFEKVQPTHGTAIPLQLIVAISSSSVHCENILDGGRT